MLRVVEQHDAVASASVALARVLLLLVEVMLIGLKHHFSKFELNIIV